MKAEKTAYRVRILFKSGAEHIGTFYSFEIKGDEVTWEGVSPDDRIISYNPSEVAGYFVVGIILEGEELPLRNRLPFTTEAGDA